MSDFEPTIISKKIKLICRDKKITQKQLAEKRGEIYQTWCNKMSRNTMKFAEVESVMNDLDCDVVFVDRKSKKVY